MCSLVSETNEENETNYSASQKKNNVKNFCIQDFDSDIFRQIRHDICSLVSHKVRVFL